MLVQVHNKLEQIEKRIKFLEDEQDSENKINELIYKINNLTLEDSTKKPKTQNKELIFGKI